MKWNSTYLSTQEPQRSSILLLREPAQPLRNINTILYAPRPRILRREPIPHAQDRAVRSVRIHQQQRVGALLVAEHPAAAVDMQHHATAARALVLCRACRGEHQAA